MASPEVISINYGSEVVDRNDGTFVQYKYGLSNHSNPNIIHDEKGEVKSVVMHIVRVIYEGLQDGTFKNAVETDSSSADAVIPVSMLGLFYKSPSEFWNNMLTGVDKS